MEDIIVSRPWLIGAAYGALVVPAFGLLQHSLILEPRLMAMAATGGLIGSVFATNVFGLSSRAVLAGGWLGGTIVVGGIMYLALSHCCCK